MYNMFSRELWLQNIYVIISFKVNLTYKFIIALKKLYTNDISLDETCL